MLRNAVMLRLVERGWIFIALICRGELMEMKRNSTSEIIIIVFRILMALRWMELRIILMGEFDASFCSR